MRSFWKVFAALALVLPLGAFVAGTLVASASDDTEPRETLIIQDQQTPAAVQPDPEDDTPEVDVAQPTPGDVDDHSGPGGGDDGDDDRDDDHSGSSGDDHGDSSGSGGGDDRDEDRDDDHSGSGGGDDRDDDSGDGDDRDDHGGGDDDGGGGGDDD